MRDTIEMVREAGLSPVDFPTTEQIKAFEALVRADEREAFRKIQFESILQAIKIEREACAKVCDEESNNFGGVAEGPFVTDFGKHTHMSMAVGAQNCAAAIRARG